ncbi:hypothetical protein ERO13_D08G089300v2 [Gossypium hirsutum]|uniref:Uncharacterized protein n=4 Tax=Gossypium TaxID=3633 RepID=A0A5J5QCJ4_GOSBA|nr:hypothetical protein ES319_D08G094100v1 [Gossypium barbadense]KAG4133315.1 hypothetical protein ERO13_D08G089300v2 [Gossypium hirsutum]TYG56886.1 hypothetical protein ES288_D08G099500v1 [Gossypium darwinii]TYH57555.1 hypothetical protein ES332_D08G098000v1 [Gossypium tomentosum]TYI68548.1 hypothetical protein E1A91_D08G096100v1 [Gossypium mustelinum]
MTALENGCAGLNSKDHGCTVSVHHFDRHRGLPHVVYFVLQNSKPCGPTK